MDIHTPLSKAKSIEAISSHIKNAEILPLVCFSICDYFTNQYKVIDKIRQQFKCLVIIRSSSHKEDNLNTSNAGEYVSVMNVNSLSTSDLKIAIDQVIKSYGDNYHKMDEVFVQPMLNNVEMSGVIFSADIDTLSPYYIVNYDESGSTDTVTGGRVNNLKTFISFRDNHTFNDYRFKKLIIATQECEAFFNNRYLDIEFAYKNKKLYLFQIRAIVEKGKKNLSSIDISISLRKLYKKLNKLNKKHPNLLGEKALFGVMPDWNPAEIIGVRPKSLALSLYKELITDETWAYQRNNYGYRNLRSHPLLVSFLGLPYIDVRVSFNSYIPKELKENTAEKLVNYYLYELIKNKEYHDKVEFKILFSCYYFGIEQHLNSLKSYDFSKDEILSIKDSLLKITNTIINPNTGLYKKDLQKVEILKQKHFDIINADLSIIDKIYWLIKNVKRYGTLPFAGVARAAFIAIQFLQSFVEQKIINQQEYNEFLNSLSTVSKQLSNDFYSLSKEEFLDIYGHLRPGTYNILSQRYDEAYDSYFSIKIVPKKINRCFNFSESQKLKIEKLIKQHGLDSSYSDLIKFIKESIEGREHVKFVFTKSLSQILLCIEQFGQKFSITKEQLAFLDIQTIINLYSTLDHRDVKDILLTDIEKNKEFYKYTQAIKLPNLITDVQDIYHFFQNKNEANFITLNYIKSGLVNEENIQKSDLENKIICIKSADPGYDYLFSKNIGGLITCYGGANSHMAIRCAEMGIPAVIGCGEQRFQSYYHANLIEIDASNKRVTILS
jgi:glutamine kinase